MDDGEREREKERERDLKVSYIVLAHGQSMCFADFLVYFMRERERERKWDKR